MIVTHPDNWSKVKAIVERDENLSRQFSPSAFTGSSFCGEQIRTDPYMERDKPTGRWRLPDGRCVAKEDIEIKTRFITYGPEDFDWLLYIGVISEEREMLFYKIDEQLFRVMVDYAPAITNYSRHSVFLTT